MSERIADTDFKEPNSLRGLRALAAVGSLDAALLLTLVFVFVSALDRARFYDMTAFVPHIAHFGTVPLLLFAMRYARRNADVLRALAFCYTVALVFDMMALLARVALTMHSTRPFADASRVALVLLLVIVDSAGLLFCTTTRAYSAAVYRTDDTLLALAHARVARHRAQAEFSSSATSVARNAPTQPTDAV